MSIENLPKGIQLKARILEFRKKKPSYTAKNYLDDFPEDMNTSNKVSSVLNLVATDESIVKNLESLLDE